MSMASLSFLQRKHLLMVNGCLTHPHSYLFVFCQNSISLSLPILPTYNLCPKNLVFRCISWTSLIKKGSVKQRKISNTQVFFLLFVLIIGHFTSYVFSYNSLPLQKISLNLLWSQFGLQMLTPLSYLSFPLKSTHFL